MDKVALVGLDFATGAQVLDILDKAGISISVAMWLHAAEYGDWRFVLSSRQLDSVEPAKAYGLIHDALGRAGFELEQTPTLFIIRMTDPFVKALRRIFGKAKRVEGMRLGGQMIGDRFIEDALIYRII